jgi:Ca2+-binding RTX toxin-like protein
MVEIVMGPSDDKVEIDSPMPVPVTVHLGGGSDVFVGNEEPDTCYSEGARRNRCYGNGGNDVCIMGAGQDGCHGGPGNDRLYGGPGADQLYGGPGNDYCDGGPGVGKSHGCERGPRH